MAGLEGQKYFRYCELLKADFYSFVSEMVIIPFAAVWLLP